MNNNPSKRILSIDVFRGVTMFLLIGEFTGLFELLFSSSLQGSFIYAIGEQFHHHPWNGLRFWDLIQPFFMFIVGLSLPFAVLSRERKGEDSKQIFNHILKRTAILLFLGWALYCIYAGKLTPRFQNVLAQISIAYLIAYSIIRKSPVFQIIFSLVLLLITESAYRLFPVDGESFILFNNFGTWVDLQYNGASDDGWAAFNAIPTAAHTIWGVLVGKLLLLEKPAKKKLRHLVAIGLILVVAGYLLDSITPIIKRIATSSFVIVSGGWTILAYSLLYSILDVFRLKARWTQFFVVIGMNSLFIYIFAHVGGATFIEHILHPFTYLVSGYLLLNAQIFTSIILWFALWGVCYWMYKRRIFIKI